MGVVSVTSTGAHGRRSLLVCGGLVVVAALLTAQAEPGTCGSAQVSSAPGTTSPAPGATSPGTSPPGTTSSLPTSDPGTPPTVTLVAMPDFVNCDVADLRALPGWRPGLGNGTSSSWRRALAHVLDQVQRESPDAVLVTGDLVDGRWGEDADGTGLFGPVGTEAQRRAAVRAAAAVYYPAWAGRFARRDLRVFPAVGDHEIGDNPWPPGTFEHRAVPLFREVFADAFTRRPDGRPRFAARPRGTPHAGTAYAVRIAPDVLLVTLDVFRRTSAGVVASVGAGQLRWLDRVLGAARRRGVRWLVVQGHAPVLPTRAFYSSAQLVAGGRGSPLWRTLARHRVDLYLAGEVHVVSARRADGVLQVTGGALVSHGRSSYLRLRFSGASLRVAALATTGGAHWYLPGRLWETSSRRPPSEVWLRAHPWRVGALTLVRRHGRDVLAESSGALRPGAYGWSGSH